MRIGEWQMPRVGAGDVLVSVGATGICAGDMYLYNGVNPYATYPVIGSHRVWLWDAPHVFAALERDPALAHEGVLVGLES